MATQKTSAMKKVLKSITLDWAAAAYSEYNKRYNQAGKAGRADYLARVDQAVADLGLTYDEVWALSVVSCELHRLTVVMAETGMSNAEKWEYEKLSSEVIRWLDEKFAGKLIPWGSRAGMADDYEPIEINSDCRGNPIKLYFADGTRNCAWDGSYRIPEPFNLD